MEYLIMPPEKQIAFLRGIPSLKNHFPEIPTKIPPKHQAVLVPSGTAIDVFADIVRARFSKRYFFGELFGKTGWHRHVHFKSPPRNDSHWEFVSTHHVTKDNVPDGLHLGALMFACYLEKTEYAEFALPGARINLGHSSYMPHIVIVGEHFFFGATDEKTIARSASVRIPCAPSP